MHLLRRRVKTPKFNLVFQNRTFFKSRFVLAVETPYEHLAQNGDTADYIKFVPLRASDLGDPIMYEGLQKFLDSIAENNGTEGPLPEFRLSEEGSCFVLEYKTVGQSTSNSGGRVEVDTYDVWCNVSTRHLMDRTFVKAISNINNKATTSNTQRSRNVLQT